MQIEVLKPAQLTDREVAAWSKLQRADRAFDNPWFRPELALAVAKVRTDVEVAVLQQSGEPVGFLPFQRDSRDVGRPVASILSDMHGMVVAKGVNWDPLEVVRSAGLVAWHFDHLVVQEPWQPFIQCFDDSPYLDLSQGYEAYVEQRRQSGCSAIKQAQRKARKLAREVGPVRFELHTDDRAVLQKLVEWKQEQLVRMTYIDVFRFDWVVDLLQVVASQQCKGFAGQLSALYAGEQLVAVHLGMQSYDVASSWIPTYDFALAKYSPGLLLHLELAAALARRGVRRLDLCRGENQLKTSLMSAAYPVALGSVECRPLNRLLNKGWYQARNLVHSTSLGRLPLTAYRRLKSWMANRTAETSS